MTNVIPFPDQAETPEQERERRRADLISSGRGTFVWCSETFARCGRGFIPAAEFYSRKHAEKHGTGPALIKDDLGVRGLWHPASGQYTDSKSHFRQMTKASGCEEVGNEPIQSYKAPELPPVRETLKRALAAQGHL